MNTRFARIRLALAASALAFGAAVISLPAISAGAVTVDDGGSGLLNPAFSFTRPAYTKPAYTKPAYTKPAFTWPTRTTAVTTTRTTTTTVPPITTTTTTVPPTTTTTTNPKLTVIKSGTGTGTVTSDIGGINCGATCTSTTIGRGSTVDLSALADSNSTFTGWSGPCSGTGSCFFQLWIDTTVTVNFDKSGVATWKLDAAVDYETGYGYATVTSSPAGINCGSDCSETFPAGSTVTLTVQTSEGSVFNGWTGACSGTGPCIVTMDSEKSVTAKIGFDGWIP